MTKKEIKQRIIEAFATKRCYGFPGHAQEECCNCVIVDKCARYVKRTKK